MRRVGQVAIFSLVFLLSGGFLSLDVEAADGYRVIGPDGRGPTPGYRTNPDKDFRDAWSTKGGYNPAGTDWGRATTPYSDPLGSGAGNWKARPATPAFGGGTFQPQMPQYPSQNYSIGSTPRPLLAPETPKFSAPKQSSGGWATGGTGVKFPDYPSSSGSGYRSNSRTTPDRQSNRSAGSYRKFDDEAAADMKGSRTNQRKILEEKAELEHELATVRMRKERERIRREYEEYVADPQRGQPYYRTNLARANYWKGKGFNFDPEKLSAMEMDRKVEAIHRAVFWREFGHQFDPEKMDASMMDRVGYAHLSSARWKKLGYDFDPEEYTWDQMDAKVKDIGRAEYWRKLGYSFDPKTTTAAEMDVKVKEREAEIDARGSVRY